MKTAAIAIALFLSGCVAPSMTIYRTGTNTNGGTAAVKAVQFYGDFDAGHSIDVTSDRVLITSQGPYINSRTADVNWKGATEWSRAVVQPAVNWLGFAILPAAAAAVAP